MHSTRALAAFVLIGGLLSSASASAQPSEEPPTSASSALITPNAEQPRVYYGWQTLLSDVVGFTLLGISWETGHATIPALGGAGLLAIGAPVLHAVHHNWLGFGVSVGIRFVTGFAFVGGLSLIMDADANGKRLGGTLLLGGSALGAIAAVLIDAVFLGFEPHSPPARRHAVGYSITPRVHPGGGVELQLTATL